MSLLETSNQYMMMNSARSMDPFDFRSDFLQWLKRFEHFQMMSGLINSTDEQKVHTLLYLMGSRADDIFESFSLSDKEKKNFSLVISKSGYLVYRNTVIPELGKSPAELMFGRKLRDVLAVSGDTLKNTNDHKDFRRRDKLRRNRYKENFDKSHRVNNLRYLEEGERVWISDLQEDGKIINFAGFRSYWVRIKNGKVRRNRRFLHSYSKQIKLNSNPNSNNANDENNSLWLSSDLNKDLENKKI